jgi:Zn-finger protein
MRVLRLIAAALLLLPAAVRAEEHRTGERDELHERFPFFPSLLTTAGGKAVASTDFEDPTVCQSCHPGIFREWNGSMHSNAFVDPVFQALWRMGVKETNGLVEQLCAGCHTAIGTVAREVKLGPDGVFQASEIARKGVQCDLCHTFKASRWSETPTREPENGSLVVDPGSVKRGPYRDSDSPYHETEYSELHTRSEFCANCHNVFHPVNNFPIEYTYNEWKSSVYAQAGIQCQDCHMMPVEVAIEAARTLKKPVHAGQPCITGPQREQVYTHEFVGGNAVVTALLGAKDHAAIAVKRLQNAASLELLLPEKATAGKIVQVKVRVRNETAGHNLPTSLTEVRQVWIEIAAKAGDREVFHSGALDAAGVLGEDATLFRAYAVDKDGHHTVKPWEIVRFDSVNTIPPKGSAVVPYSFELPEGAKGPLAVSATLHYRSYDQAVANLLLGKDAPKIPVIDMASASGAVPLQ